MTTKPRGRRHAAHWRLGPEAPRRLRGARLSIVPVRDTWLVELRPYRARAVWVLTLATVAELIESRAAREALSGRAPSILARRLRRSA